MRPDNSTEHQQVPAQPGEPVAAVEPRSGQAIRTPGAASENRPGRSRGGPERREDCEEPRMNDETTASPHRQVEDSFPTGWRLPTHPGEILRGTVLPALDLSEAEVARRLRVPRRRLDRILSCRSRVTPEVALRLGKFFGTTPDVWLRLQEAYDLWRAREQLRGELEKIPLRHTIGQGPRQPGSEDRRAVAQQEEDDRDMGSDLEDLLREAFLREGTGEAAARHLRASAIRELQRNLKPLAEFFEERKREARESFEELGLPIEPPPPEPVARVRIRVLRERTFPSAAGEGNTVHVGEELVTDEANLQGYVESGFAELIGPAPSRPAPRPRSFGDGTLPPEWEQWQHELPAKEWKRRGWLDALSNAVLVYKADSDFQMVSEIAYQAGQGFASVAPEVAALWPMEMLLFLAQSFPAKELIRLRGQRPEAAAKAGGSKKFARGIQAAVNHVYRDGLTEAQCWEALLTVIGRDVPDAELDKGWYTLEDVEEGRYEFMLDHHDHKAPVTVRDTETGRTRTIRRASFRPYVKRAREQARTSSPASSTGPRPEPQP